MTKPNNSYKILIYIFLIALTILSLIPFYLVMINSTHSSSDIVTKINLFFGNAILDNYETMQSKVNIWNGFKNSLLISVPYTICTGYFGAMTAFGFAKYDFKGKNFFFAILLGSMMLPSQLSIIGFYQLNLKLHLLNTFWPFIIPGIANASAVFFLKGFIEQSITDSMLEAARVEGCSEFKIFNRIVLPLITPGVATMCIFNFVSSWNNYLGPLVILSDNQKYTMPVMISAIKGLYLSNYGAMYLAIAISVLPVIIVYLFGSKFIINGLTAGSDK
ncbi:carbohydrate ABC transporter permease [Enterococcus faecalis]|uniref:carbohydrate ABC transporter permease n=1 Tax=Enterococcus faecalis TaxID=1351 RepID=UPI0011439D84|nr:carbohydrate ABC transporter permease [Enterococcus faecalis]NSW10288.1 carbohydrate ABC transporter permease [Enterococcus faecalis]TQB30338.1 carbohydrate ABC transporter permease [Enterococcus faecalis]